MDGAIGVALDEARGRGLKHKTHLLRQRPQLTSPEQLRLGKQWTPLPTDGERSGTTDGERSGQPPGRACDGTSPAGRSTPKFRKRVRAQLQFDWLEHDRTPRGTLAR
jgi:hypothetical protein